MHSKFCTYVVHTTTIETFVDAGILNRFYHILATELAMLQAACRERFVEA